MHSLKKVEKNHDSILAIISALRVQGFKCEVIFSLKVSGSR